jgi:hypothetical protein
MFYKEGEGQVEEHCRTDRYREEGQRYVLERGRRTGRRTLQNR